MLAEFEAWVENQTESFWENTPLDGIARAAWRAARAQPAEVERLRALSVENILLDVVPGEGGMGLEVYATSVEQVEKLLSDMALKLDELPNNSAQPAGEAVAWWYEMHAELDAEGYPTKWMPHVQMIKPSALYHTRNIRPLIYGDTAPPAQVPDVNTQLLECLRGYVEMFQGVRYEDDDEPPRTFGCRHAAESCPSCEGLVNRWKLLRASKEAIRAATMKPKLPDNIWDGFPSFAPQPKGGE